MIELSDELKGWIGRESEPVRAPGPVEWSDVRRYMNATGDHHPMWGNADPDRNPSRTGAVAPPAMVLDVLRPPVGEDDTAEGGERAFPSLGGFAALITVPDERSRLNAGTEIEWVRPLCIGDWVTVRFKILDIRCTDTQSGPAVFITEERRYSDQAGGLIAVVRQTTVRTMTASGSV